MEKNFNETKPRKSEQILPVPWLFVLYVPQYFICPKNETEHDTWDWPLLQFIIEINCPLAYTASLPRSRDLLPRRREEIPFLLLKRALFG